MSYTNKGNSMITYSIIAIGLVLVLMSIAIAEPGIPDNAALLYYQAFLVCPDPDNIPQETIRSVYHNVASNEDIAGYRKYVEDYKNVIELVRMASNIQQCDWAMPYPQGEEVRSKRWRLIRSLTFLIAANVRVLAFEGEYTKAFSESLMLRRVARHIAEDPNEEFYSIPVVVERVTLFCVNRILDVMPPDEMTLNWLREQLATVSPVSESLSAKMKQDSERQMRTIRRKGKTLLSKLRQELSEKTTNEEQKSKILALTDEELLELIRGPYTEFLDTALKTLNRKATYEENYIELQKLAEQYCNQAKNNPAIILILQGNAEMLARLYAVQVTHLARFNAVKTAVEIYLLKAKTGHLPKTLPDGLPKDPLSGKDFEYKMTETGFTLRSSSYGAKDLKQYDNPEYEFKVVAY